MSLQSREFKVPEGYFENLNTEYLFRKLENETSGDKIISLKSYNKTFPMAVCLHRQQLYYFSLQFQFHGSKAISYSDFGQF